MGMLLTAAKTIDVVKADSAVNEYNARDQRFSTSLQNMRRCSSPWQVGAELHIRYCACH